MPRIVVSLALFCLALPSFADEFDRSGTSGRDGYSGGSGGSGSSGSPAGQPSPGASAQSIHLWVRQVAGSPGVAALDFGSGEVKELSLRRPETLWLRANGGQGGSGGDGGSGGNGRNGSDGRDCGMFSLWATSGEDGGRGGDAGAGTSGADGGDAGDIEVNVNEADLALVAQLKFEAKGGSGGRSGRHGTAGRGGSGGRAGSTSYYDFNEGKYKWCLSFVSNGRSGGDGTSAYGALSSGRNGRDGRVTVRVHYENGSTRDYSDVYHLAISDAQFEEEFADGVLEIGERLKLKSLRVRNEGAMPSPGENPLQLVDLGPGLSRDASPDTPFVHRSLQPGEGVTADFSSRNYTFTVSGNADSSQWATGLTAGAYIPVARRFSLAWGQPVRLQAPGTLTVGYPSRTLTLTLSNASTRARQAKLKVALGGAGASSFRIDGGGLSSSGELTQELAAGASQSITLTLSPVAGARFGSQASLAAAVQVNDLRTGSWKDAEARSVALNYQPPSGVETANLDQRIKDLNIYVTYPNNSRYRLNKIWVWKTRKSPNLYVQYELDKWGPNNSPRYEFSLEELAPLLDTIAGRGQLTREQIVSLVGTLVGGKASGSWAIRSCQ